MGYAAGIDDNQVGFAGRLGFLQTELFEQFANLLAFVLVDFTAKCIYGKSRHYMI
jgi:hypothetical protein